MCGIVGYIGKKDAEGILIEGLKRLEYRGYDSAGVAILEDGKVVTEKSLGRIASLEEKLAEKAIPGHLGISHTRWATHGAPSVPNAHPHTSCDGKIAIVHNGIIENYDVLRKELMGKGHAFKSETDSEVLAHLIEEAYKGDLLEAVLEALKRVEGTYGIAAVSAEGPGRMVAARQGSPLILGVGKDENFVASDVSAILGHTDKVVYLNDGEVADIRDDSFEVTNISKEKVPYEINTVEWSLEESEKGGYDHFMMKEIMEQPEVIRNTIRGRLIPEKGLIKLGGLEDVENQLKKVERVIIVACGTARLAGVVGEYLFEEIAGIPTEVEYASEFRYRNSVLPSGTAVIAISQSGETADTLAAIREAKGKGALTLGIVNAVGSTIARETDAGVYNHAGPEIAVASTKAFVSQVTVLTMMAIMLGRQRSLKEEEARKLIAEIQNLPVKVAEVLTGADTFESLAKKYAGYDHFMYLGRKYTYPVADEGALKLKEISYIHAEGYAAGEMKHGPIALIDENFPTFFLAPKDSVYEKTVSNIEEIKARRGKVIALTTEGNKELAGLADDLIYIPETLEPLEPILAVAPLQLFAYFVSVHRGLDVDKPRNLAKSVTVE